jgi:hypothetical protein
VLGCVKASGGSSTFGNCVSDARLKKNVQQFPPVLDKLVQLRPVSYDWRSDEFPQLHLGNDRSSGLIAQELESVFPEMVSLDKKGFKRVNYSELPTLMLQAIRELKAENDSLRQELKAEEERWAARNQDRDDEHSEVARLRAGVERLATMVTANNGKVVQATLAAATKPQQP